MSNLGMRIYHKRRKDLQCSSHIFHRFLKKLLILRWDREGLNRISMERDSSFDTCQDMNWGMKWCEEQDSSLLKGAEVMLKQTCTIVNVCGHQTKFSTPRSNGIFQKSKTNSEFFFFSYSSAKMRSSEKPQE